MTMCPSTSFTEDISAGRSFYIQTFGCQMNKLDSELVASLLQRAGYVQVQEVCDADVVLLNTCSVREHAEQRVLTRLYQLRELKRRRPGLVVGVLGCMAQQHRERFLEKLPFVDVLCGPGELDRIGELVDSAITEGTAQLALADARSLRGSEARCGGDGLERLDLSRNRSTISPAGQAYVRVMRGCDKFCSYCVVPYVRGPERSRPPENILREIRTLIDAGCRELTLLGQTINSYRYDDGRRTVRFAELLRKVHELSGLRRIRFITSYPADFDVALLEVMAELPRLCPYLHVPAQSGSDRILAAMNRGYTRQQYLQLIQRGREIVPELTVAGDFIVGFPGETEEGFQQTLDLCRQVRYSNCFVFRYSPRPGTVAARRFKDDVPAEVKARRNQQLLDLQREISTELNAAMVGRVVEVLVEGPSKKARRPGQSRQLTGRTACNRIAVFDSERDLTGEFVQVRIVRASALTLFGQLVG